MNDQTRPDNTVASRERSAQHVLEGYRERRRRRRGEDTFFGSSALFRSTIEDGVSEDELDSRRSTILEEAEDAGMPRDLAEFLYDIAWEEGLDPAIGFELVKTGLGVSPPSDGLTNAPDAPTVDRYLPAWMFPATPPDQLLRERMLRMSFRRLRALLEKEEDVDEALRSFANEPDVGHYGY